MSIKLNELAEKLGISLPELREKINELGFELSDKARTIDDEVGELVLDELSKDDGDIANIYDELIAEEREREIVKSQRKKNAGKETKVKKSKNEDLGKDNEGPKVIEIPDSIAVKEFAEKTGVNAAKVIGELMKNGILANINQQIDFDTAQVIAEDLGVKIKRIRTAAGAAELMTGDISNMLKEDDPADLIERPPVVCVMGHVDHGKTSLLDAIRETNITAGESGGITQHIGAYQVEKKAKLITFLDTPGHEAFTSMRARGAKVTDIAILVVAADEGIKPQTVEAINHAKDAGVPIIVAANKIDKPGANLDKLKGELTENGLQPEDWGGSTVVVPVSALTKQGIDELLDMILLTSELEQYKANPNREAIGTVIETHLDQSLGPVATVLINTGSLKIMNNVVVGDAYGRIKVMKDHTGKPIRVAGPSTPVFIAGLSTTPKSGDILQVVSNEKIARAKAEEISELTKEESKAKGAGLNQIITQMKSEKVLKLIVKSDVKGSLEAIKQSIAKIKDEEVAVKIIHSAVGTVTESDVMMASASNAYIVAFHTDFDSPNVAKVAEREGVEVKKYAVIYDLLEDIKNLLTGMLKPEIVEVPLGRAEVKAVFLTKKKFTILGARVLSGKLENKAKLRIIRGRTADDEDNIVGEGYIDSLRKVDEQVKEIGEGNECGIQFSGNIVPEVGDIFFAYKEEEKRRTIA